MCKRSSECPYTVSFYGALVYEVGRGGAAEEGCGHEWVCCTNMSVSSGRCVDLHGAVGPITGDAGHPCVWHSGEEDPRASSEEDQLLCEPPVLFSSVPVVGE